VPLETTPTSRLIGRSESEGLRRQQTVGEGRLRGGGEDPTLAAPASQGLPLSL
jgi:hypothetical protein